MSGKRFTAGGDDWEEKLLKQLSEMFKQMGMAVDAKMLKTMMDQIQSQFEEMGLDPEKMADGKVELNLEGTLNDLAKMVGATFPEKPPVTIEVKTDEQGEHDADSITPIDENDIYVSDDGMVLTIDCSRVTEIDDDGNGVDIILTNDGAVVNIYVEGRPHPVRKYSLTRQATAIGDWTMNNGILDLTLEL